MAAAAGDGAAKPLQSAMKLANKAIELDTDNRPRVRLGGARRQQPREALGSRWAREGVCEGIGASDARGGGSRTPAPRLWAGRLRAPSSAGTSDSSALPGPQVYLCNESV